MSHEKLPDGRYKLLLYGLFRAEVVEPRSQGAPYRKVRVRVRPRRRRRRAGRATVDERAPRGARAVPGPPRPRRAHPPARPADARQRRGAGRLADAAAEAADLDADERYRILAEPDVLRRLDVLIGILDAKGPATHKDLPARADPSLN